MLRQTSARPLALVYLALIVYASLYPFAEWRDQGIAPWAYLTAPWPQFWSGFDVLANAVGYAPMGFLLVVAAVRGGAQRLAVVRSVLLCAALSFSMEALQTYLPMRVASNADLVLNLFGATIGALTASALARMGALQRWSSFRRRWFSPQAHGALVLVALWPLALLFPLPVPFGLGQVLERFEPTLLGWLADVPGLAALSEHHTVLRPMHPGTEMLCITLGALVPNLLAFGVIPVIWRRVLFLAFALLVGCAMTSLSAALSFGPTHAWVWIDPGVISAFALALLLGLLAAFLSPRASAAWLLLVLVLHLSLLNQAPLGAYFTQTLQTWEQGRFVRFNGLAQWLGWLWPYAALLYVLRRISRA